METIIEPKDLRRLEDIKSQSGKEIGLAVKQAKLIKDSAKITRRYLASVAIFGENHPVTRIFATRKAELSGSISVSNIKSIVEVEVKEIKIKTKAEPKIEPETKIKREQSDFPIGCGVKLGDRKGSVIDHEILDKEMIRVDFEGVVESVNIYLVKRF
jgi:hypothetical protein